MGGGVLKSGWGLPKTSGWGGGGTYLILDRATYLSIVKVI